MYSNIGVNSPRDTVPLKERYTYLISHNFTFLKFRWTLPLKDFYKFERYLSFAAFGCGILRYRGQNGKVGLWFYVNVVTYGFINIMYIKWHACEQKCTFE